MPAANGRRFKHQSGMYGMAQEKVIFRLLPDSVAWKLADSLIPAH